jgi:hypothetical protein
MNARLVVVPAVAVITALVLWLTREPAPAPGIPAATWRIGSGADTKQARNYDELPPSSPVRLSFTCDEPRFVYVFSHSVQDGTLLLFPSPDVRSDLPQPLPAGNSVLPGKRDDKELAWNTRAEVQPTTTFLIVAAKEKQPELEALLPKLRRWTNTALTTGAMDVTKPPAGTEAVAGPRTDLPDALLQRAAARSVNEVVVNGPLEPDPTRAGVWIGSIRVKEAGGPKEAIPPK